MVQSLGIIDSVELEPGPGFIALTGETGAGKSLLVSSLKLLAGERATPDLVRTGDERTRVEGRFELAGGSPLQPVLEELGLATDATLLVRREVTAAGRSRAWVNDASVAVATLGRLAPELVSILGQHEQHGLADPSTQRRLVDEYGRYPGLLEAVRAAHAGWVEAAGLAAELAALAARRRDRLDAIAFQLAEIDAVAPQPGEDLELRERRQLLRHAVRLLELEGAVLGRVSEGDGAVVDQLARAGREVDEMVACGLRLEEASGRLGEARLLVEEVVRDLSRLLAGLEQDPAELDAVESRLHRLEQLLRKYGEPVERVVEHRRALVAERAELERVADRLEAAESEARAALAAYDRAAVVLDRGRRRAGGELLVEVAAVLAQLHMGGTRLELRWLPRADAASPLERDGRRVAFDADGVEECELLIAPNPGEELRPLERIASGGELSRIHLALRTALRRRRPGSGMTLLFDEVDSGLGGGAAAALAGLLTDLARVDQVFVVTHLPQVAARASTHYRVEKVVEGGRAVTRVERLDRTGREEEVARMLAGDRLTGSARAHARALLESR